MAIIGLILGIVGISTADTSHGYHPGTLPKAAMGLFLAVYALVLLLTAWLLYRYSPAMLKYQKKLFLAIALSAPFLLVRMIYSALGDYTNSPKFSVASLVENNHAALTVYLCMSVLEEIISMVIAMFFGMSAILASDFVKFTRKQEEPTHNSV
jgi:membrane protein implicated in regulation of membrane protease activity